MPPDAQAAGVRLQRLTPDDWRLWRKLRLVALEEAPEAFAATLAQWTGPNDTPERWQARLCNVAFNCIGFVQERPAGMISATAADETGASELLSVYVAPHSRGRGVGDALIDAAVRWAGQSGAARVILRVAEDNARAIALYARQGFSDAGPCEDSAQDGRRERWMERSLIRQHAR